MSSNERRNLIQVKKDLAAKYRRMARVSQSAGKRKQSLFKVRTYERQAEALASGVAR